MIRSPLGLRLDPARPLRDQFREAARVGAKGVVADATGDLAPDRLSETGRREVRQLLRTAQIDLIALHLPTRRPFDSEDQLDDRLNRAERAFGLAYDLGTRLVLARVGAPLPEADAPRREIFTRAVGELGRRAEHRGVRLAVETATESGEALRGVLEGLASPGLAASIEPAALLSHGHDPSAAVRALGPWLAHAYVHTPARPGQPSRLVSPQVAASSAGALDWEEFLGALEEINYRGFLTLWPDPAVDVATHFAALTEHLSRY